MGWPLQSVSGYRKTIKSDQTTTRKQTKNHHFRFLRIFQLVPYPEAEKNCHWDDELQKMLPKKIETRPDKADRGYQIIGIRRNLRLDYFSVFALLDYVAGQFCSNQPIRVPFILRIFESPF